MAKAFRDYSRTAQASILAGGAVMLAAAAFWYWVLPLNQSREALATEVSGLRSQNTANRAFERQRTLLEKQIADADAQLVHLRTMVPDEPAADDVVRMVREAENASGVHIRSLSAQAIVAAEQFMEMPFKVRIDGTYYALLSFFDRLGEGQRITNVTDLSLGPATQSGHGAYKVDPSETVGADFTLLTYYNLPAGAAPSPKVKK